MGSPIEPEFALRRVVELLPRFAYRFGNEVALHEGIAQVLNQHGVEFQREVVAGPADRFDFLVEPGIVIEAKVKGSLPQALRQVARYAARDDVQAVILVSSRFWSRSNAMPEALHGKPVRVVHLRGAAF